MSNNTLNRKRNFNNKIWKSWGCIQHIQNTLLSVIQMIKKNQRIELSRNKCKKIVVSNLFVIVMNECFSKYWAVPYVPFLTGFFKYGKHFLYFQYSATLHDDAQDYVTK